MRKTNYLHYGGLYLEGKMVDKPDCEIPAFYEIPEGETAYFSGKNIHLSTIVTVKGKIYLQDCSIYFNEYTDEGTFILESGAEFLAEDCVFICSDSIEKPSIRTKGENTTIEFDFCYFIDCCNLLSTNDSSEVIFNECELKNCNTDFMEYAESHALKEY